MRRVRYTLAAARELDLILDYIAARSPGGAKNVQRRLDTLVSHIANWPETGRAARNRPGMRRIFAIPYPYAIDYRFTDEDIIIHDIRHTARRPKGS